MARDDMSASSSGSGKQRFRIYDWIKAREIRIGGTLNRQGEHVGYFRGIDGGFTECIDVPDDHRPIASGTLHRIVIHSKTDGVKESLARMHRRKQPVDCGK